MQGNHREEFPKCNWLPRRLLEAFERNGWKDESWHNDACPIFGRNGWAIFCDAKAHKEREMNSARFMVVGIGAIDVAAFLRTAELIEWLDRDGAEDRAYGPICPLCKAGFGEHRLECTLGE